MPKIVFIGAGSGFGAKSFVDIMSFEELRDSEIVLVDINPNHLDPVTAYCRKVVEHYQAGTKVTPAADWRDGVLDGAQYVITSFAQGGPAYEGVPYHHEIAIPQEYGIYQNVADTVGIGGVFRTMRTGPELLAIAQDMERRCPGAYLINYVNPMSMLTRIVDIACPKINMLGLCHNIQYGIRAIARWLKISHKEMRYEAAGINHMDWYLRLEYLDGRDVYPDLAALAEAGNIPKHFQVHFELMKRLGYMTTESSGHCAEYLPYFMMREAGRESMGLRVKQTSPDVPDRRQRWMPESDLIQQTDGRTPLKLERSFEYGAHIIHALETENVYRMHLNVRNDGLIDNLPDGYNVEVPCTADRTGIHPHRVGSLPIHLAALCRGMADMQTLTSDAFLEQDVEKAKRACMIDPMTSASATPAQIGECFDRLLEAERPWLEPYWSGREG